MDISEAYKILNLPEDTRDMDSVTKAYRKLVKLYHPDVNPSDSATEKMQEITAAYERIKFSLEFRITSIQYEPDYEQEEFKNQKLYYLVRFFNNDEIQFPEICPKCLRKTNMKIKLFASCMGIRKDRKNRDIEIKLKSNINIFTCCEDDLGDSLIPIRFEKVLFIVSSNQDYASKLADLNNKKIFTMSEYSLETWLNYKNKEDAKVKEYDIRRLVGSISIIIFLGFIFSYIIEFLNKLI